MNDRRDFELTSSDKNIEIRPEAVMFIFVCSSAAFSLLLLHEKDLFSVASVPTNLLAMYVI